VGDLRCYCCGGRIGENFVLVSMAEPGDADRVFVMRPECLPRVDRPGTVVPVRRRRPTKEGT
jgi:hypothetical protein